MYTAPTERRRSIPEVWGSRQGRHGRWPDIVHGIVEVDNDCERLSFLVTLP